MESETNAPHEVREVAAGALDVAYLEFGPPDGWPCVLLHGFPYDAHASVEAARLLAGAGARAIVPWLRGFGPTRFRSADTPRSGEQAALGADLLALLDALDVHRAVLAGYDWGGRAACVVSALRPERVVGLVTGNGYNVHDIARSQEPRPAVEEAALWYQWYFHGERGRRGLQQDRRGIARLLWRQWSPNWAFDEATFDRSAAAFDNPDFVDVAIHSYRQRYGLVAGDPAVADLQARLAEQPTIAVPTVHVDGDADGVNPGTAHHRPKFSGPYEYRVFRGAGHNPPQERPREWADAVLAARAMAPDADRA